MAFKKKAVHRRPARKSKPVAHHTTTHHKTRRKSSVGSTSVGKTTHRRKARKKGFLGASATTQNRILQIGEIALGMGLGAGVTHMVLRPIEHKIAAQFAHPMVAKAMPWGEIALGGLTFILAPWKLVRNMGLGVMGSGVHAAVKGLPFHLHSPAESISGMGDYTTLNVPINGTLSDMVGSLIEGKNGEYVKTPTVGESIIENHRGPVRTPIVGAHELMFTPIVSGSAEDDELLFNSDRFGRR